MTSKQSWTPTWKAMVVILAATPSLWILDYFLSRWLGCDTEMARWRATAATVAWPVGCFVFLLLNGGLYRIRMDLLPIIYLTHQSLLEPKREVQDFLVILRGAVVFALVGGVFCGVFYRIPRLIEGWLQRRRHPAKPCDPSQWTDDLA